MHIFHCDHLLGITVLRGNRPGHGHHAGPAKIDFLRYDTCHVFRCCRCGRVKIERFWHAFDFDLSDARYIPPEKVPEITGVPKERLKRLQEHYRNLERYGP